MQKNIKYTLWRLLGKSHEAATELKSLQWQQFWYFVRDGAMLFVKNIFK